MDDPDEPTIRVDAIHDERGYRRVRRALARDYDLSHSDPNIEVAAVDYAGDRKLILHHNVLEGRQLVPQEAAKVVQHLANIWGYEVLMIEVGPEGRRLREYGATSDRSLEG